MTGAVVGSLRVVLGLDSAALDKGYKDSQSGLASFASSMTRIAAGIGLEKILEGFVNSSVNAVKHAVEFGDQLNKMSQSSGVSVEAFAKLKYAADLSDVSMESLGKSLGKLSKAMVNAGDDSASKAGRAFAAMGVDVKNQDGTLRSSADVLNDIAAKFATYKDSAEKTSLAITLFGKSGAAMIPLLNQGRDGLKEAGDEAAKFGLVLSKDVTEAAERFNDNLKRMDAIKQGLFTTIASLLLPSLEKLSEMWLENKKNSNFTAQAADAVKKALEILGDEAVVVTYKLANVGKELGALLELVQSLGDWRQIVAAWENWEKVGREIDAGLINIKSSMSDVFTGATSFSNRFGAMWDLQTAGIISLHKEIDRLGETWKKNAPGTGDTTEQKNALQTFLDSQAKRTAAQAAEAETVGKSVGEQAKLKLAYEANAIVLAKGIALTPTLTAQIAAAGDAAAAAAMKLQGANLIEQTTSPWVQRAQQVQQYTAAMTLAGATSEQISIKMMQVQFPAFSAASIAATDFGMQIDQLATGAINSLSSNLAGLIAGTKTAAEAFKAFATQIIADLAAMIIKLLIYKAIRTAIFGFSEGGVVGGGSGFGFFADGGAVAGPGTGTSDSIPAMVSNGEFIVNAQATKQFAPLLNAINSGNLPSFAEGGNVSQPSDPVQSAPSISKTIVLQGVMWGRDQMRDLFAALNEGMRDGHKLNVQFA